VAARSKVWFYDHLFAGIKVSTPAGVMNVSVVSVVLCDVEVLRQANHSSRGVLECGIFEWDHNGSKIRRS